MSDHMSGFEDINLIALLCGAKANLDSGRISDFKKGTNIYIPNDKAEEVFFILEGRVKIGVFGANNKEIIKTIKLGNEVFGELALVSQKERGEFAYALENTKICICSLKEFRIRMADSDLLRDYMWHMIGHRAISVEKRLVSLVFKNSRTRILDCLVELTLTRGQRVGCEILIRNFITHQELANLTATSRQTVTTILNELRNKDYITFDRKRLLVRNLDALRKEAMAAI